MPVSIALTWALLLAFATPAHADVAEQTFDQAVREKGDPAAARKLFAKSAKHYAELHADGASNVALYRNWGNAEFLAGHVPQAILAFRRGLMLDPGNAELLDNLHFARGQVSYPAGFESQLFADDSRLSAIAHWLPWLLWLPGYLRSLLALGTVLFWTLACFAGIRWYVVRRSWLPGRAVLLLVLAGTCGFYWQREEARLLEEQAHPLVVIDRDVGFFRGNGESYPRHDKTPMLPAGVEARRLLPRGDWLQIELPGGATGWVPKRAVLVDEALP